MDDTLLNTAEAAQLLRLAPQTLKKWRHLNQGPPYASIGRRIVYRRRDLDAFIEAHFDGRT